MSWAQYCCLAGVPSCQKALPSALQATKQPGCLEGGCSRRDPGTHPRGPAWPPLTARLSGGHTHWSCVPHPTGTLFETLFLDIGLCGLLCTLLQIPWLLVLKGFGAQSFSLKQFLVFSCKFTCPPPSNLNFKHFSCRINVNSPGVPVN